MRQVPMGAGKLTGGGGGGRKEGSRRGPGKPLGEHVGTTTAHACEVVRVKCWRPSKSSIYSKSMKCVNLFRPKSLRD